MKFVGRLLHLEGLAVGGAAVWLFFAETDVGWGWLAVLFLAPDLAFVAFPLGERVTVRVYNLTHTYVAPVGLGVVGIASGEELVLGLALIWFAHIGVDRFAGYGLKYSLARKGTHMRRVAEPGGRDTSEVGSASVGGVRA